MFLLSMSFHFTTPGSSVANCRCMLSPTPSGRNFLPNKIGNCEDTMEISWNIDIGTRTVGNKKSNIWWNWDSNCYLNKLSHLSLLSPSHLSSRIILVPAGSPALAREHLLVQVGIIGFHLALGIFNISVINEYNGSKHDEIHGCVFKCQRLQPWSHGGWEPSLAAGCVSKGNSTLWNLYRWG